MPNILEVRGLNAGYGEIQVLKDVGIEIAQGSITAVIGSNGAGKTTLMRTLSGLIKSSSGSIIFQGEDITAMPTHSRVEQGIALVPEGRLVFPDFTVNDTLKVGSFPARARQNWADRVEEMYQMFPRLRQRQKIRSGSLSGGEQQMLALARGLMSRPNLLLLDEPSLGLAPTMADEVFEKLREIRAQGVTICLVEQNVYAALELADFGYVLENGQVAARGSGADILQLDSIKQSYLGL
jgi:branched-chain amino acid transport system ATP-binding protein